MAEVDFGAWTGQSFDNLAVDPAWQLWNNSRGDARVPGGENMAEVQDRAWGWLETVAQHFDDAVIAVVSHCDVIRAVIARVLGLPLENLLRFDVDPASISRIVVGEWGARVLSLNERAA
jgi:broad specificity phosphatase PhoE